MQRNISVIGCGKLGASLVAVLAKQGHCVVGVDVVEAYVAALNAGHAPVQETNLESEISANAPRISATMDTAAAVAETDLTFVVVPTPSDDEGCFSAEYAKAAFEAIGRGIASKDSYHLVVLISTVLPGTMRYVLAPAIEEASGKTIGPDFGLCYSPAFIALGSIIHNLLNPDFLLVGQSDDRAGDTLQAVYCDLVANDAQVARMTWENAELTKISVNTYVTTKIAFANMLADMCDRLPGGDVDVVSDALGMDRRIGRRYLTGGLGYGGPCFPRDNRALIWIADRLGADVGLARTTDQMNRDSAKGHVERYRSLLAEARKTAVLGLAYKPDSHWAEESQGLFLAEACAQVAETVGYDPLARDMAQDMLGDKVQVLDTLEAALDGADLVLITTQDKAWQALTPDHLGGGSSPVTVIDFWRGLPQVVRDAEHVRYVSYGKPPLEGHDDTLLRGIWID